MQRDYARHAAEYERTGSAQTKTARDSSEALLKTLEAQIQGLTGGASGGGATGQLVNSTSAVSVRR